MYLLVVLWILLLMLWLEDVFWKHAILWWYLDTKMILGWLTEQYLSHHKKVDKQFLVDTTVTTQHYGRLILRHDTMCRCCCFGSNSNVGSKPSTHVLPLWSFIDIRWKMREDHGDNLDHDTQEGQSGLVEDDSDWDQYKYYGLVLDIL